MVCAAEMVPAMVLESARASAKVAASGMLCVQLSSWLQLSSAGSVADADAIAGAFADGNTISGAIADGDALVAMVPASENFPFFNQIHPCALAAAFPRAWGSTQAGEGVVG